MGIQRTVAGGLLTAALLAFTACQAPPAPVSGDGPAKPPVQQSQSATVDPNAKAEEATLTHAPDVPPPIERKTPAKLVVHLEVREIEGEIAKGTQYTYWTFGGKVPGEFIRVRKGDEVEFHLQNHQDNKMPHNIDLHAVTGQGGGAAASVTAPGHESVFSFKALNPGLFVYHCATAPVGMHIANGMYGLILVEPEEGLAKVDKEYYVMQSDFYTEGKYGTAGLQAFSMEKALAEDPDYVVFNGSVGALLDDKALTAKVGETVRIFIGNGGPNMVSSFHIIGEIFDKVHIEGGSVINENVQTTLIPAGGAAIVEFKCEAPATLILVDHSIFRAFNKGALAMLKVDGEPDKTVYSGKQTDLVYHGEGSTIQTMPGEKKPDAPVAKNKEERMTIGKTIFTRNCVACHQADGTGIPGAFPPLAKSDFITSPEVVANVVANGLQGKIKVNGQDYDGVMPKLGLTDENAANVSTYVLNTWGNKGGEVTPAMIAKVRTKN